LRATTVDIDLVVREVLARHHLGSGCGTQGVTGISRDLCGLHSTRSLSPYISLWARSDGFEADQLDAELYGSRSLARVNCMRNTVHCVPSDELPVYHAATTSRFLPEFHRFVEMISKAGSGQPSPLSIPPYLAGFSFESTRGRILDLLESGGPMTSSEIAERVPELGARIGYSGGKSYSGTFSLGSRVITGMCLLGDLIRTRPRGTWRSNLWEYAPLGTWLPSVELGSIDPMEATASLVRRYLATYGPATTDDICWWAGLSASRLVRALDLLEGETERVKIGKGGPEGLALLGSEAGSVAPPGACMLPSLDPLVMGYRDRSRFLSPRLDDKVFDRNGNSMPTVLEDGKITGIWMEEGGGMKVMVWSTVNRHSLMGRARELSSFLGLEGRVDITSYPSDVYVRALFRLGRRV